jgi:hypothetical protein
MTFSAGLIWFISALEYSRNDHNIQVVAASARHNLLEFGEVNPKRGTQMMNRIISTI